MSELSSKAFVYYGCHQNLLFPTDILKNVSEHKKTVIQDSTLMLRPQRVEHHHS
jgi:hypothetical protein